jgi:hypothetical protein
MMQPTLDALHALGGVATNQEIVDWIAKDQEIDPSIVERLHKSGGSLTELAYRLMWTRTYLRHYGLIRSAGRGQWELTEIGKATQTINSAEITRFVKQRKPSLSHESEDGPSSIPNEDGSLAADTTNQIISPTPHYPSYHEIREYLRILNGVSYNEYRTMYDTIIEQSGSPQEQVDWTNPDEWVLQRLDGASAKLALRLWHDSHKRINPRHTRGHWRFCTHHGLLVRGEDDMLRVTSSGEEFRTQPLGSLEAKLDQIEGVLVILRLIAENGSVRRRDIIGEYAQYCRAFTTLRSDTAIQSFLYKRLRNLIDRILVQARGQRYEATEPCVP